MQELVKMWKKKVFLDFVHTLPNSSCREQFSSAGLSFSSAGMKASRVTLFLFSQNSTALWALKPETRQENLEIKCEIRSQSIEKLNPWLRKRRCQQIKRLNNWSQQQKWHLWHSHYLQDCRKSMQLGLQKPNQVRKISGFRRLTIP